MPLPESFREYTEQICQQIRWKKVRPAVAEEIEAHLLDQQQALMEDGFSEEEAAKETLRQMGDPVSTGAQLDRVHRPKAQWGLLRAVALLLLMGFCFSLISNLLRSGNVNLPHMIQSYLVAAVILVVCYFVDFSFLAKIPVPINIGLILILLVLCFVSEPMIGTKRYLVLPGGWIYLNYNLAYLSLLVPICYSLLIYQYRNRGFRGIIYCGLWFLPYLVLMTQYSPYAGMMTALFSCLILLCMAIWSGWFGVKRWKGLTLVLMPTTVCAALSSCVIFSQEDYRKQLFLLFHPETAALGGGYHYWTKRELLKNAHFIGHGNPVEFLDTPMASTSTLSYDWDSFLTLFIYDFGWIILLVVLAALVLFGVLAFRQVRKQTSVLGKLVSLAIVLTLLGQCVFYLLESLGFGFISSLSLPLISPGNAALLMDSILIGFLLSIFRNGEAISDKKSSVPLFSIKIIRNPVEK